MGPTRVLATLTQWEGERHLARFSRTDLGRFGSLVSERQYAFALKIATGVRDVLLGRDRDAGLGL